MSFTVFNVLTSCVITDPDRLCTDKFQRNQYKSIFWAVSEFWPILKMLLN